MAKTNSIGLQETKGMFKALGYITGVDKESFCKDTITKTNKKMRMLNAGLKIGEDKTIYLNLNGMERDYVYFSGKDGDKNVVEKVEWNKRDTFNKPGFNCIGVKLGLKKALNEKGELKNINKTYTEYDACDIIRNNVSDDTPVFVLGKIEYSTYKDAHQIKFVPTQISLTKDNTIDFSSDKYEEPAFQQVIVYKGITKNDNGTFTVSASIVTYNSIEDAEFTIERPQLAKNFKSLKPYTALNAYGRIVVENSIEVVEEDDDDGWGSSSGNPFNKVTAPTVRKLVIDGVDASSIDTDLYSESIIEEAIAKINSTKNVNKDFGSDDGDWGKPMKKSIIDDDDDEWD